MFKKLHEKLDTIQKEINAISSVLKNQTKLNELTGKRLDVLSGQIESLKAPISIIEDGESVILLTQERDAKIEEQAKEDAEQDIPPTEN